MIHDDKGPPLSGEWKQILPISTFAENLDFVVWPTQGFLDENKTFYPHFFLVSGFALTLFLALSFYFWIRIKKQTHLLSKEIMRSERLESRFKALSTSAKDAIIVCNARGQVIFWNPMASKLFQFLEEEVIGKYIYDLIVPSQYIKKYQTDFKKFRKTGRGVVIGKTIEILAKRKDGSEFPIEISMSAMTSNGIPEATAIIRDITERKRAEAIIHHQANYDALTDLANRHLFEDRLRQALANSDRTSSLSAMMVIDVDDFKLVNDRHGHQSGDELLGLLAQRLVESIRSTDTAARMGGDEFVVILTNIKNKTEITLSVDKIVKKLSTPYVIQGKNFSSSVSIGVAIYPENASNADELMKKADLAMYVAKRRGKNQLVYAESD
jgi:diguanylate cyclase (GGDEF)-like protein/PAS domain S-box-containing protein